MPLIRHSQYVFYPGGGPASGILLGVNLRGGNQLVPLFSNKAGTTPQANPVTTGPYGEVDFYAAPGDYVVWLAGESFPVPVDASETDESWPDTFVHTQATPATSWTIGHHFGVRPSVTILVEDRVTEADVTHTDDETAVVTFGAPTGGVALLRR